MCSSSGLGLSVSKGLVEAHDGQIRVEETPGGGATFVVELPLSTHAMPGADELTAQRLVLLGDRT